MSSYQNISAVSFIASEAIAIARIVDLSAAKTVSMSDDAITRPVGVSAEAVASGDVIAISSQQGSIVLVELGGTLTAGARVSSGTDGVAVTGTTTVDQFTVGTLVEGGDAGDIVGMLFDPSVDAGT